MRQLFIGIVVAALSIGTAQAAVYEVDPAHSSVSFKIKHLLSKTQGNFNTFSGTIDYEPGKPEMWKAAGTIDTASIDTNNDKRDAHLRSADFFDVEKYSAIEFQTTGVKDVTDATAKIEGILKMHGVEKPVVLDAEILGVGDDPWGNTRAAFMATTKIKRSDFGIVWNQALNAGGFLLGEDVEIVLEVEAIKK